MWRKINEEIFEVSRGKKQAAMWRKSVAGRGHSTCRGPEVAVCLLCQEATVAGVK